MHLSIILCQGYRCFALRLIEMSVYTQVLHSVCLVCPRRKLYRKLVWNRVCRYTNDFCWADMSFYPFHFLFFICIFPLGLFSLFLPSFITYFLCFLSALLSSIDAFTQCRFCSKTMLWTRALFLKSTLRLRWSLNPFTNLPSCRRLGAS